MQQQHYPAHITHAMCHRELILLEEVIVQIVFPLTILCTSWADVSGSICRVRDRVRIRVRAKGRVRVRVRVRLGIGIGLGLG